jgi:hypothetical protein
MSQRFMGELPAAGPFGFMPTGSGGQPGSAAEGIAEAGPGPVGWTSAVTQLAAL